MDPGWAMVAVVVAGQLTASVWVIATLRGDVRAALREAARATETAKEAHQRLDRITTGRKTYGTS